MRTTAAFHLRAKSGIGSCAAVHPLVGGRSAAIQRARLELELLAAQADVPILLEGDSGTGKTAFAEHAHAVSPRSRETFLQLSMTEIEDSLISSELFGHVPGAFTGAAGARTGLLASAAGGTVFIDEIGKASKTAQYRLLTVIESKKFRRVGSDRPMHVDVRFIFATNVSLESLVDSRDFLPDLYQRMKMFSVQVPALADRKADIPTLLDFFLHEDAKRFGYDAIPTVEPSLIERFTAGRWPGNIRELHCATQLLLLGGRGASHLTDEHLVPRLEQTLPRSCGRPEATCDDVAAALRRHGGNRKAAADELGVHRTTLFRYMKRFSIGEADPATRNAEVDVAQHARESPLRAD